MNTLFRITCGSVLALQVLTQSPAAYAQDVTVTSHGDAIEIIGKHLMGKLTEAMRNAALTYPNVLASQKEISALNNSAAAAILNQVSVQAQVGGITGEKDERNTSLYSANGPLQANGISNSIGINLTLSLASFLQSKGIALTADTKKAALEALQMQNATNVAQAFMGVVTNRFREYFLVTYVKQLEKLNLQVKEIIQKKPKFHIPINLNTKISSLKQTIYSAAAASNNAEEQLIQYTNVKTGTELARSISVATEKTFSELMKAENGPYLAWSKIETTFAIPESEQDAMAQAETAPVMIQAENSEKIAKNNWYIAVAGFGPTLFATFSRQHIDNYIFPDAAARTQKLNLGDTWTAGFKWAFGGGILNTISANHLLEDSTRYTTEVIHRSLHESVAAAYHTLADLQLQMIENQDALGKNLPKLLEQTTAENLEPVTLQGILSAYGDIDSSTASFMTQINSVLMSRLQVLGQTGGLLPLLHAQVDAPEDQVESPVAAPSPAASAALSAQPTASVE